MDVYDTHFFLENTMHYMHKQDLEFLMDNVYRLFLDITIQYICLQFNNGLSLSLIELNMTLMTFSMKSMHTYHSSLPGVIHPPHVKNVGYSRQPLQLFLDWLVLTDSTSIMSLRKT